MCCFQRLDTGKVSLQPASAEQWQCALKIQCGYVRCAIHSPSLLDPDCHPLRRRLLLRSLQLQRLVSQGVNQAADPANGASNGAGDTTMVLGVLFLGGPSGLGSGLLLFGQG